MLERLQRLLDDGYTVTAAADEVAVARSSVHRLIREGKLHKRSSPFQRTFTARELVDAGFQAHELPGLLLSLDYQARQRNPRIHKWIGRRLALNLRWDKWGHVKPQHRNAWESVIAALPIVDSDIQAPALTDLADLIRDGVPWAGRAARVDYHRQAEPLLHDAHGQIVAWVRRSGLLDSLFDAFPERDDSTERREEAYDTELNVIAFMLGADTVSAEFNQRAPDGIFSGQRLMPEKVAFTFLRHLQHVLPDIDRESAAGPSIAKLAEMWCECITDQWLRSGRRGSRRGRSSKPTGRAQS